MSTILKTLIDVQFREEERQFLEPGFLASLKTLNKCFIAMLEGAKWRLVRLHFVFKKLSTGEITTQWYTTKVVVDGIEYYPDDDGVFTVPYNGSTQFYWTNGTYSTSNSMSTTIDSDDIIVENGEIYKIWKVT